MCSTMEVEMFKKKNKLKLRNVTDRNDDTEIIVGTPTTLLYRARSQDDRANACFVRFDLFPRNDTNFTVFVCVVKFNCRYGQIALATIGLISTRQH